MLLRRIIPTLLLKDFGLVKTKKFSKPKYIGDPINAVRIFNEKETDELILLYISASNKKPNFELISKIAEECFMPLTYSGGVRTIEDIKTIINLVIEKVSINSMFFDDPNFIRRAVDSFGSSTIIVSIDIKRNIWGKQGVSAYSGTKSKKIDVLDYALLTEKNGAGEIFINSIDRDGMKTGYDVQLLKTISENISVPIIACGGVSSYMDFKNVFLNTNVSACATGSIFVFHGNHDAVLISYPNPIELRDIIDINKN